MTLGTHSHPVPTHTRYPLGPGARTRGHKSSSQGARASFGLVAQAAASHPLPQRRVPALAQAEELPPARGQKVEFCVKRGNTSAPELPGLGDGGDIAAPLDGT